MQVLSIVENEDGSALLQIDMTDEEKVMVLEVGFVELIKRYINEVKDGT